MAESTTGKRALVEDDDTVEVMENDRKRFKTDFNQLSLSLDNIRNEKDGKKWNILPSVVYELLGLFKSGEKHNNPVEKEKLESISDIKKEIEVIPNTKCQNKQKNQQDKIVGENENPKEDHGCNTIPNVELQKTKRSNKIIVLKSSIEDSTMQNEEKLNISTNETGNIKVQKELVLNKKATPAKNINFIKVVQTGDKVNKKTDISKNLMSTKSYHKNNVQNCTSKTKNNVKLPEKVNLLDFLNKLYLNGIKNIPTTKPTPCICKYCIYVDNLPLEQSVVQNQFKSNDQFGLHYKGFHSKMYSSNFIVSNCFVCASNGIYTTNDCSCVCKSNSDYYREQMPSNVGISKYIWTNDLTDLMRKNEEKYKTNYNNYKCSKSYKHVKNYIMNKVHKAAEHIKSRLPLCVICNRSKFSNKPICEYCDIPNHTTLSGYYRCNSDYNYINNKRY